jgi:hypothetical protein
MKALCKLFSLVFFIVDWKKDGTLNTMNRKRHTSTFSAKEIMA